MTDMNTMSIALLLIGNRLETPNLDSGKAQQIVRNAMILARALISECPDIEMLTRETPAGSAQ